MGERRWAPDQGPEQGSTLAIGRRRMAEGTTPPPTLDARREQVAFEQAVDLIGRGAWTEAREQLRALALDNPREKRYRVYLHYAWAGEHEAAGRTDEARIELRRALTLDPTFSPAQRALSRARPTTMLKRLFRW